MRVNLDVFEGPLDLLLHLIRMHELDVYDIPIALITDQYLEYVDAMHLEQLDIAAEYLLMAATLAHIKSKMLLPKPELEEEEGIDPRQQLVEMLLAYQRYKIVAENLDQRVWLGRDTYVVGVPNTLKPAERQLKAGNIFSLAQCYHDILRRKHRQKDYQVKQQIISLRSRILNLVDRLKQSTTMRFSQMFGDEQAKPNRSEAIVSLLATLELVRLRVVRTFQSDYCGPIHITADKHALENFKPDMVDDLEEQDG